jgi:hypothetical protein
MINRPVFSETVAALGLEIVIASAQSSPDVRLAPGAPEPGCTDLPDQRCGNLLLIDPYVGIELAGLKACSGGGVV